MGLAQGLQGQVQTIQDLLDPASALDFGTSFKAAQTAQTTQDGRRAVDTALAAFVLSKVGKQILKSSAKHVEAIEKSTIMKKDLAKCQEQAKKMKEVGTFDQNQLAASTALVSTMKNAVSALTGAARRDAINPVVEEMDDWLLRFAEDAVLNVGGSISDGLSQGSAAELEAFGNAVKFARKVVELLSTWQVKDRPYLLDANADADQPATPFFPGFTAFSSASARCALIGLRAGPWPGLSIPCQSSK